MNYRQWLFEEEHLKELLEEFFDAGIDCSRNYDSPNFENRIKVAPNFEEYFKQWLGRPNSELDKPKVIKLEKTCDACPSQWELTLEDGRMVYVRFRWGNFTANISPSPTTQISDAVSGESLLSLENFSDSLDGYLEESKMIEILSEKLNFSIKGN